MLIQVRMQLAFWMQSVIHCYWIFAICFSSEPLRTTPLAGLSQITHGSRIAVAILLAVGVIGGWLSIYGQRGTFLFRAPQTFVIGVSLWGTVSLLIDGHYADGVARSFWFLSSDLLSSFVIGLAYIFTTRRRFA